MRVGWAFRWQFLQRSQPRAAAESASLVIVRVPKAREMRLAGKLQCPRGMTPEEIKSWTFHVAARTIRFVQGLPPEPRSWVFGKQLLRSSTSVASQYRAACRAQSRPDFVSKMKRMEEEADESTLWLALLRETGLAAALAKDSVELEAEFSRLTGFAVASAKTAAKNLKRS